MSAIDITFNHVGGRLEYGADFVADRGGRVVAIARFPNERRGCRQGIGYLGTRVEKDRAAVGQEFGDDVTTSTNPRCVFQSDLLR